MIHLRSMETYLLIDLPIRLAIPARIDLTPFFFWLTSDCRATSSWRFYLHQNPICLFCSCFQITESAELVTNLNVTSNTCPTKHQHSHTDHVGPMSGLIIRSVPHQLLETPSGMFLCCHGNSEGKTQIRRLTHSQMVSTSEKHRPHKL